MRTIIGAAVAALALVAAGCGGDSDEDGAKDEQAVRTMLSNALTTEDADTDCRRETSAALLRRIYGTLDNCLRVERDEQSDPADRVDVSAIRIDGDRATARVRQHGGTGDGSGGELSLVKAGGEWRVDSLSVGLLRSLMRAGIRNGGQEELSDPALRRCMEKDLLSLPDAEFTEFAYGAIGERPDAQTRFSQVFAKCGASTGDGEVSALRRTFEQGIAQSMRRKGFGAAAIDCVNRRLRRLYTDEQLVGEAGKRASPALREATARALSGCR